MTQQYLSIAEVAQRLGRRPKTLQAGFSDGSWADLKAHAIKFHGRWLIPVEAVDAVLASARHEGVQEQRLRVVASLDRRRGGRQRRGR